MDISEFLHIQTSSLIFPLVSSFLLLWLFLTYLCCGHRGWSVWHQVLRMLGLPLGLRLKPASMHALLVLKRALCLALGGATSDACPCGSRLAYSVFRCFTFLVYLESTEESPSLEGVVCFPRSSVFRSHGCGITGPEWSGLPGTQRGFSSRQTWWQCSAPLSVGNTCPLYLSPPCFFKLSCVLTGWLCVFYLAPSRFRFHLIWQSLFFNQDVQSIVICLSYW